MMGRTQKRRASALSPPDFALLCDWAHRVNQAFAAMPYLVGSVARAEREWRDVDVRVMLANPEWRALTNDDVMRLRALNLSVSLWGRQATGLPIDFQFQRADDANDEFGNEVRNAIGIDPLVRVGSRRQPLIGSPTDQPDDASGVGHD